MSTKLDKRVRNTLKDVILNPLLLQHCYVFRSRPFFKPKGAIEHFLPDLKTKPMKLIEVIESVPTLYRVRPVRRENFTPLKERMNYIYLTDEEYDEYEKKKERDNDNSNWLITDLGIVYLLLATTLSGTTKNKISFIFGFLSEFIDNRKKLNIPQLYANFYNFLCDDESAHC